MEENQLHKMVIEVYQEINNKWLKFHVALLAICALVTTVSEILMFFIISNLSLMNCTPVQYLIKYIIVPACLAFSLVALGHFVLVSKNIPSNNKQYIISFLFSLFAFVLSLAHSGFVAVLVCSIFPVLMTIMYENQKLTFLIAICNVIGQLISGYLIFWDADKILNSSYLINMFILVIGTLSTWLICGYMIKFTEMKRKIIIGNEIKRYQLQEKIKMDGLTNIGNRLALIEQLEKGKLETETITYLAMMDIDNFKNINDTYGHIFGDDVLRYTGAGMRIIQGVLGSFRYGGDEFCMTFTDQDLEVVIEKIKYVQKYLETNVKSETFDDKIYISVGISSWCNGISSTTLLQQADKALYTAKSIKHGKIIVFEED